MDDARDKLTAYFGEVYKSNIARLNETATAARAALFANDCELLKKQVAANEAQIACDQAQIKKLVARHGFKSPRRLRHYCWYPTRRSRRHVLPRPENSQRS